VSLAQSFKNTNLEDNGKDNNPHSRDSNFPPIKKVSMEHKIVRINSKKLKLQREKKEKQKETIKERNAYR
jgi:hypothetical protein